MAVQGIIIETTAGGGNSMQILFQRLRTLARKVARSTSGQDLIEYALLSAFIAVAVAAFFPTEIVPSISTVMSKVAAILNKAP
jgi:Flp pilus assembly pilin Flp